MKKIVAIAAALALAIALTGCVTQVTKSSSESMSASDTSASSASASAASTSASSASTVKWKEAKTAEEAAKAAGVEKLGVPKEGTKISLGDLGNWKYYSAEKMAEADGSVAAAGIVIRKAVGNGDNTQGATNTGDGRDLAGVTYAHQWSVDMDGTNVRCYGNEKGKASKAIWDDGKYSYSILVLGQGDNWQDFGVPDDDIAILVKAVKDAESGSGSATGGNALTEADIEQIIWNNGYGEIINKLQVQLNDGIWYWEVTTRGSDGSEHTWVIDPNGKISSVDVNGGEVQVPNLVGMTAEDAAAALQEMGLSADGASTGTVTGQAPEPGTMLNRGDTVSFTTDAN